MRSITFIAFVATAAVSVGACSRGSTDAAAPGSGASSAATPAANAVREITIPAGTLLPVVLNDSVGSDTSRVEDKVSAHLTQPVAVDGVTVAAVGSTLHGVVTDATQSGRVKGLAHVAVRFESLAPVGGDERYPIQTNAVGRTAQSTKEKDALEIGGGAAGGALIGALVGGKKGAAIGTAAGGGAGTAVVLSTRGKEVSLPRGSALTLKLTAPVTVKMTQ